MGDDKDDEWEVYAEADVVDEGVVRLLLSMLPVAGDERFEEKDDARDFRYCWPLLCLRPFGVDEGEEIPLEVRGEPKLVVAAVLGAIERLRPRPW